MHASDSFIYSNKSEIQTVSQNRKCNYLGALTWKPTPAWVGASTGPQKRIMGWLLLVLIITIHENWRNVKKPNQVHISILPKRSTVPTLNL